MARVITIPNNWTPRHYQLEALQALDGGLKRAFLVWHRRAGKDNFSLNYTAKELFPKIGAYYHMLPTSKQARKVVWHGIDRITGIRYIDQAFPVELRKRTVEDEMLIEFKCGSIWQAVGSDNYDSLVGTNPLGMVFSEWSLSNPRAYDYMRPILAENKGWAIFIGTPRGKNFFHDQYQRVKSHPGWFCSLKTVDDTGAVSREAIQAEREAGMPESRIQQEFFCSFEAENIGAVYDKWITALEQNGKITNVPYDPRYPVETAWDRGHRDANAIWFLQRIGREVCAIDYDETIGKDLRHFVKIVHAKPYVYSRHVFPHDMNQFEYGAGATISEQARNLGLHHVIAPKLPEADGIEHLRAMLPRMRFDRLKCARGLNALRSYHYEEDGEEDGDKIALKTKPKHDWSSHGSKALEYASTTPEEWGIIPAWARPPQGSPYSDWMQKELGIKPKDEMIGHNGGPPMDDYDPLAQFRGFGHP